MSRANGDHKGYELAYRSVESACTPVDELERKVVNANQTIDGNFEARSDIDFISESAVVYHSILELLRSVPVSDAQTVGVEQLRNGSEVIGEI